MGARQRMTMRCDVQRDDAPSVDPWGNQPAPEWAIDRPGVPCYAWVKSRKLVGDEGKTAVIEDMRIMLPKSTNVSEDNRLGDIKDRVGTVIFSGPFDIVGLEKTPTHIELLLNRVS